METIDQSEPDVSILLAESGSRLKTPTIAQLPFDFPSANSSSFFFLFLLLFLLLLLLFSFISFFFGVIFIRSIKLNLIRFLYIQWKNVSRALKLIWRPMGCRVTSPDSPARRRSPTPSTFRRLPFPPPDYPRSPSAMQMNPLLLLLLPPHLSLPFRLIPPAIITTYLGYLKDVC